MAAPSGLSPGETSGLVGQAEDPPVIVLKTLVLGLAAHIADIDLLDDDGELEGGEDLVPADCGDLEPGAGGIALNGVGAGGETLAPGRHRGDLAPSRVVARLDPIIEEITEIGE